MYVHIWLAQLQGRWSVPVAFNRGDQLLRGCCYGSGDLSICIGVPRILQRWTIYLEIILYTRLCMRVLHLLHMAHCWRLSVSSPVYCLGTQRTAPTALHFPDTLLIAGPLARIVRMGVHTDVQSPRHRFRAAFESTRVRLLTSLCCAVGRVLGFLHFFQQLFQSLHSTHSIFTFWGELQPLPVLGRLAFSDSWTDERPPHHQNLMKRTPQRIQLSPHTR